MLHTSTLIHNGTLFWNLNASPQRPLINVIFAFWTVVPFLSINGFAIQLAGLLVPLSFALWQLRSMTLRDTDALLWASLAVAAFFDAIALALQARYGFPPTISGAPGLHLLGLVIVAPGFELVASVDSPSRRLPPHWIDRPLTLAALTFAVNLPFDLAGAGIMAHHFNPDLSGWRMLSSIGLVGGAGWLDGLILLPASTALLTVAMRLLLRRTPGGRLASSC